ncbi:hypothetical protein BJX70DRAFT_402424 [Aspergillus crustosus]
MADNTCNGPVYVGLDFGTTGSAVAFMAGPSFYLKELVTPQYIDQWPSNLSGGTTAAVKVPSIMSHKNGDLSNNRWRFQTFNHSNATRTTWFKLLINPQTSTSQLQDRLIDLATGLEICRLPDGLSAGDMVAQFLDRMTCHLLRTLQLSFVGRELPDLNITLTLPSGSSDKAKSTMLLAATRAGLDKRCGDRVWWMEEPEAALYDILDHGNLGLQTNEVVLVADLGGATAINAQQDFAVARVPDPESSRQLHHIVVATGLRCGGAAIDRGLYTLLDDQYGAAFKQLRGLYDPIITKISSHIQKLKDEARGLGNPISKIVVVGGLAVSPWVARCLMLAHDVPGHLDVIFPPDPQLTVARGAAIRASFPLPTSRLVPNAHYGFSSSHNDNEPPIVYDPVVWLLRKNEPLNHRDDSSGSRFRASIHGAPINLPIFRSTARDAPQAFTDPSVTLVGEIPLDLRPVNAPGINQTHLDMTIRARTSQTSGCIVFTVYCEGHVLARQELKVAHQVGLEA